MSAQLLKVSNLNKRFGRVVVADGISFEVGKGEAFGIVGPNGAGKSTLLNLINGTETVDSGEIFFGEEKTKIVLSTLLKHSAKLKTFYFHCLKNRKKHFISKN